jgi:glycosyltransferase involved in cell wall biosynthesis
MKRVLHLITTIKRGGAENQLLILVREQVKQGFDVKVAYLKGGPELENDLVKFGAEVLHDLVGVPPFFQSIRLARLISDSQQIIHAHLPRAELVAFLIPRKFKFIVSRHNTEAFFPGAPWIISVILSRIIEFRAAKIIAISKSVKDFLLSSKEIRSEKKIQVIHYGYNPMERRPVINRTGPYSSLRIGTISRLSPQKDLSTLFLVFKEILRVYPNSRLSILGEGEQLERLTILSHDLGIHDHVDFLGRSNEVLAFLNKLDIFILTSKYEGFGMVLLEAMDAGIPIVASRTSAIPEVLGVNFPGLCEVGEVDQFVSKVLKLTNQTYRQDMLAIQEHRLGSFSSKNMGEKIENAYLT